MQLLDLSADVPATTTATAPAESTVTLPEDGRLEGVVIRWPSTTDALGVRVELADGDALLPTPGADDPGDPTFVEAIDLAGRWPLDGALGAGQELVAQFTNPTAAAELVTVVIEVRPP